jgi:hypothetical protein
MASKETVLKMFAAVWMKFPSRRINRPDEMQLATEIWSGILADVPDQALMGAVGRYVAETAKIYPDDDPFAAIRSLACPTETSTVTYGDCLQLVLDAVSQFGYMRENEALAWIKARSRLAAAVISRFGFREFCMCEEPDVARGQLRQIFEGEKKRADEIGFILDNPADQLEGGTPKRIDGPVKVGNLVGGVLAQLESRRKPA